MMQAPSFVYARSMARTWWVGIALWVWMTSTAWAQGTPPDLVRMHDGSFVRGTIVESTSERVVIQLATGEVRTLERSTVAEVRSSDSPATTAPTAPTAPTTGSSVVATTGEGRHVVVRLRLGQILFGRVLAETASAVTLALDDGSTRIVPRRDIAAMRDTTESATPGRSASSSTTSRGSQASGVRISSAQDGLSLHHVTGSTPVTMVGPRGELISSLVDTFALVCVAPCIADLPAGSHRLGVARGTGHPVRADEIVHLGPRDLHLELDYVDRSGIRVAGWLTWIGGIVAGGALALAAIFAGPEECRASGRCTPTLDLSMLIAGGVIICIAPIVGVPLAFWGDTGIVRRP